MTDEIKKMLEPAPLTIIIGNGQLTCYTPQDFDRLKRGFECLMEQVDSLCCDDSGCPDGSYREQLFRELEAAMRGEG